MPLPVINIPLFALSGVLGGHFGVCEGRSEGLFEVTLEPELTSQCFSSQQLLNLRRIQIDYQR